MFLGTSIRCSFKDSSSLCVCKIKRIFLKKVLQGIAKPDKFTMLFFFGFKLHLLVNKKGGLLNVFIFSDGNVKDSQPLNDAVFFKAFIGKMYAGNRYIRKTVQCPVMLWYPPYHTDTHYIIKCLMEPIVKILLRKCSIIETTSNKLKSMYQI